LIDTNVTIDYFGETLPGKALALIDDIINGQFNISIINKIELLGIAGITKTEELKFQEFINAANVLELNEDIVNGTIELRKHYKTKLPDAIIAASALVNQFTIITRNKKDFEKIKKLEVIDPYSL
jgi:predicted nucleic acid-binding protein